MLVVRRRRGGDLRLRPRGARAAATTPSSSRPPTSRCTRSRARRARRSRTLQLEHDERLGAGPRRRAPRAARRDAGDRRQLPPQPDRRAHRPRDARRRWSRSPSRRGAHLFSDEVYRWLEHAPAALLPGAAELVARAVSLGVMSKTFALPGLRIGWLACRDRDAARAHRGDQGLHDDLQQRPERDPRAHRAARAATTSWPAAAPSSTPTCRCSTTSSRAGRARFEWVRPRGAAIGFPRLRGRRGDRRLRARARGRGGRAAAAGLDLRARRATTSASASGGATCPRRSRAWSASPARGSSGARRRERREPGGDRRRELVARRARRDRASW